MQPDQHPGAPMPADGMPPPAPTPGQGQLLSGTPTLQPDPAFVASQKAEAAAKAAEEAVNKAAVAVASPSEVAPPPPVPDVMPDPLETPVPGVNDAAPAPPAPSTVPDVMPDPLDAPHHATSPMAPIPSGDSVYPATPDASKSVDDAFESARKSAARGNRTPLSEGLCLLFGLTATGAYVLLAYKTQSMTWANIASSLLAAGSIFFALKNYRDTREVSPLIVIGLAGATYALINIIDLALLKLLFKSTSF